MKRYVALVLACAWTAAAGAQVADLTKLDAVMRAVPDGPIAKINGVSIPREEFVALYRNELITMMARANTEDIPTPVRVRLGVQCIGRLVERELLYQEAQKRGMKVSDAEVTTRWNEGIAEAQEHAKAAGKTITEAQVLEQSGATREQAFRELRKAMLVEKVGEAIAKESGVSVSDAEVKKFYTENRERFQRAEGFHLRQIFAGLKKGADPAKAKEDARKKIEKALARIHAGESFEAVARDMSEAPDRERGGDMGPLPTKALPPFFSDPAAKMKPGDLSDIIESELGCHLFQLVERVAGSEIPLEKAAPRIRSMLQAKEAGEAVNSFCDQFANKPGYIEVYLQLDKTLAHEPGFEKYFDEIPDNEGSS